MDCLKDSTGLSVARRLSLAAAEALDGFVLLAFLVGMLDENGDSDLEWSGNSANPIINGHSKFVGPNRVYSSKTLELILTHDD